MPLPEILSVDPVLFFDGECGLCQRIVHRLLALDRRGTLRFAPLQGRTAGVWMSEHGLPAGQFQSLVFLPEGLGGKGDHLRKTDGVIAALHAIGHHRSARALGLVPRPLRDSGYRVVARLRHRVFGPWKSGQPLRPEWQRRFLD